MATTTPVNTSDLDGLFKQVYADKLENLIPDNSILVKKVPFQKKKRIGAQYNQPVILQQENGVTYAAAGAGAFALNAPINMATKNAEVPSVQMLLRSQMDYETASKASGGNDARAFFNSTKLMDQSMLESITQRLECSMLYGSSTGGLGVTASGTEVTTTTADLVISDATWAVGIWSGQEGAVIDCYDTVGGTPGTNLNSGDVTISAIDVDNKTITITASTADIDAITLANTTGVNVAIFWKGTATAAATSDMNGIDKIITNTGSLFGISAADYNLWKGNTYSAGSAAITLEKVIKAPTVAVGKGLNEDIIAYVSPTNFAVLNNAGSTNTGDSALALDGGTGAGTTNTYALRVIDVVPDTSYIVSNEVRFPEVIVKINLHQYNNTTGV